MSAGSPWPAPAGLPTRRPRAEPLPGRATPSPLPPPPRRFSAPAGLPLAFGSPAGVGSETWYVGTETWYVGTETWYVGTETWYVGTETYLEAYLEAHA